MLSMCYHFCFHTPLLFSFFFFNDTATTEIYTLSLHDALPISLQLQVAVSMDHGIAIFPQDAEQADRSEEHTSELQSPCNLVCRLLLEKKKKKQMNNMHTTYEQQEPEFTLSWIISRLALRVEQL